ncbi:MAG: pesticidal protein Cry15Aa [Chloroflexi bacterium]|nr:pesticidal protein Cry15Aa [Chloroflexota bacterium]
MPLIKRYANRKLYDTTGRRYVSLDAIGEMVRQGQEVKVADHVTGDDLTAMVLSQVIAEQERRQAGRLPRAVLAGLIRTGGETWEALRRGLAPAAHPDEEIDAAIERRIEGLVARGEVDPAEANRWRRLLTADLPLLAEAESSLEVRLERTLLSRWVPTRTDFQALIAQVEELEAALEKLSENALT